MKYLSIISIGILIILIFSVIILTIPEDEVYEQTESYDEGIEQKPIKAIPEEKSTPGFEMIVMFISLYIALLICKRKIKL